METGSPGKEKSPPDSANFEQTDCPLPIDRHGEEFTKNPEKRRAHPRLVELYRQLFKAEQSGVSPELIICGRGTVIRRFSRAEVHAGLSHKPLESRNPWEPWYSDYAFLKELLNIVQRSSAPVLEMEERLLGPGGYEPTEVIRPDDLALPAGALLVCAISKKNLPKTGKIMHAINGKKGRVVTVLPCAESDQ